MVRKCTRITRNDKIHNRRDEKLKIISKFKFPLSLDSYRRRGPWKSHGKAKGRSCTLTKVHATFVLTVRP